MAMATGSDVSFNRPLSKDDLSDLIHELYPVAHKYKIIGIQLKHIDYNDIKSIEK